MAIFQSNSFFTRSAFCLCLILMGLQGCASNLAVFKDTVGLLWSQGGQDHTLAQVLNPNLRYLRVTVEGRSVLLVLGYVEPDGVEVWYSGQSEVIKLRHGRIVAAVGTPVEWLAVRHEGLPAWTSSIQTAAPKSYLRVRDLKANYQFGITEQVSLDVISKPEGHQLQGVTWPDRNIVWFSERYQPSDLPPSVFVISTSANQPHQVVYSWQCLAATFCLKLQPWSLEDHTDLVTRSKEKAKAKSL